MPRQLLILDVDETLVYADETPLAGVAADFRVGPYWVCRRPFLTEFIATISNWFELAVWSSASGAYVRGIVDHVFAGAGPLRFVWSCERCTRSYDPEQREYYYWKNLSKVRKLGVPLERILVVDDSPEKLSRHYGNHIHVRPFPGDQADTELRDLLPFLDRMRTVENVRRVEKRHWRTYGNASTLG